MNSQLLIQTTANAIAASGMYALIAVGLTLAFGVMQMANLAHGHFFMVSAYTVYALYALGGWPFWWAVAAAVVVGAVLGLIVERVIFRPLQGDVVSGFIGYVTPEVRIAFGQTIGMFQYKSDIAGHV